MGAQETIQSPLPVLPRRFASPPASVKTRKEKQCPLLLEPRETPLTSTHHLPASTPGFWTWRGLRCPQCPVPGPSRPGEPLPCLSARLPIDGFGRGVFSLFCSGTKPAERCRGWERGSKSAIEYVERRAVRSCCILSYCSTFVNYWILSSCFVFRRGSFCHQPCTSL